MHLPLKYNEDHDSHRIKPWDCQHLMEEMESNHLRVEYHFNSLNQVNKNAIYSLKRINSREPDTSLRTTNMKGSGVC